MQTDGEAAVLLLLEQLVRSAVPDLDRAGAVLALGDLALEARVVERVVLDADGEGPLARLERHALRYGPARKRSVPLEPEVVVQPARVVPLHDEDRLLPSALLPAERLRCLLRIALALVFGRLRAHAVVLA